MRNVCTINLAAVSRRDLCYVSENESFCFGQKMDFQVPGQAWGSGVGVRCSLLIKSQRVAARFGLQPIATTGLWPTSEKILHLT